MDIGKGTKRNGWKLSTRKGRKASVKKDTIPKLIADLVNRQAVRFGYDSIPPVTGCKKCGRCCGPVVFHVDELEAAYEYLELTEQWRTADAARVWFQKMCPDDGNLVLKNPGQLQCPFFRASKGCTIYPVRPMVCRQYGLSMDKSFGRCPNRARAETLLALDDLSALVGPYFQTIAEVGKEGGERAKWQGVLVHNMTELAKVREAYAFGAKLVDTTTGKVVVDGASR